MRIVTARILFDFLLSRRLHYDHVGFRGVDNLRLWMAAMLTQLLSTPFFFDNEKYIDANIFFVHDFYQSVSTY